MLLRSGVRKLRLIDFDQVSLSSLNRHAVATRADVGMPKATCLKVRATTCRTLHCFHKKPCWLQADLPGWLAH